ncbi:MAG TPA: glycosyl hydrolase [Caldithrix abyssi]|uniref:Glycosyl hydrolase n=1 Tax=Caldithrix abyssi TaxID=187145 RepID=A0A7V5PNI8_CALAY|nr:glycosyl hydrolase [Caldithrix abyssi]
MRTFYFSVLTTLIFALTALAQKSNIPYTPAQQRLQAYATRQTLKQHSLVKNLPFRSIGPTVMSGRAVDIDADPAHPGHFYVAYASGGLWFTDNNGVTFRPLFEHQPVMTIGDIAVDWRHSGAIWVGTGENNSSRSSYSGTGIYKSTDHGKSWQHMGLAESHHIGRIVIHPEHPDTVWVAALGHLYSNNPERGVYKTTDGGQHWRRVLYVNDSTGAIDLVADPQNPNTLYAAMWERSRRAWNFKEGGPGSGIYKSMDGGESWQRLTMPGSGFPADSGVGRIGLAVYPGNPQILYAFLDNQNHRPKEEEFPVSKEKLRVMSVKDFLKLNADDLNDFLDRYHFPMEFNADTLFQLARKGKIKPVTLVEYLEDANAQLFETPVIGAEVYRSDDGGINWRKTHQDYLDKMVYTFGYYFGQIRVAPDDPQHLFLLGVPVVESTDGGQTFHSLIKENVHVDNHALWINPHNPRHLILGNDGGINISYDGGKSWLKANAPPVGQFYTVAMDMAKPFHVLGGLQDNGVWYGPHNYKPSSRWQATGHYPYRSIMDGDGMQIAVDTRDNNTVYTGYQFGNYFRIDLQSGEQKQITPKHKLGQRPYRFNWQTPIHLSVHNQDILYLGSQKLHRSMDKGDHWEEISPDLTRGGKKGDVPYGTLTTIHESPLKFGLIYTGSDDGLVYVTKDGGATWQRISDSLPQNFWVSRVQASAHDTATVYLSLNGYRWDNFRALIYKSTDYGQHWQPIGLDLPDEPVNVIKEDPVNPQILYVGTDHGLYVSLNGGKSFMAFDGGLPDAPVHDLAVHPRDKKLVVATHGRSLYLADVAQLQKLTEKVLSKPLAAFKIPEITYTKNWGNRKYDWRFNEPEPITIGFYCQRGSASVIQIKKDKLRVTTLTDTSEAGLNYVRYDLTVPEKTFKKLVKTLPQKERPKKIKAADNGKFYLPPGDYTVTIRHLGQQVRRKLTVKPPKKKERKKSKKTP